MGPGRVMSGKGPQPSRRPECLKVTACTSSADRRREGERDRGVGRHIRGCQVKTEQERAAGYTLSFLERVTGQECHLSTGASGVKCDITEEADPDRLRAL
ncbi:hypothetical protein PAMP_024117 [Pampus punctatissimus]